MEDRALAGFLEMVWATGGTTGEDYGLGGGPWQHGGTAERHRSITQHGVERGLLEPTSRLGPAGWMFSLTAAGLDFVRAYLEVQIEATVAVIEPCGQPSEPFDLLLERSRARDERMRLVAIDEAAQSPRPKK